MKVTQIIATAITANLSQAVVDGREREMLRTIAPALDVIEKQMVAIRSVVKALAPDTLPLWTAAHIMARIPAIQDILEEFMAKTLFVTWITHRTVIPI